MTRLYALRVYARALMKLYTPREMDPARVWDRLPSAYYYPAHWRSA